ncbi:caffeic acid 3-O-methyltransferase-like [Telopea speciosissima]|uniref:caffeic acid 3-O-methyltransferase-like n=1 Tax=Telopea speciosissima TaxID=54955 RepID=UPI001CC7000A|nr:caffeic acid 3-O-methyltransferase-like [Telopea speciosissima]
MDSLENHPKPMDEDEEAFSFAMRLASSSLPPMVLKAILELDVLEIIAKEGPGAQLSPLEIVAQLPTQNPDAPVMLDRMLQLLASYLVLTCSVKTLPNGQVNQKQYGLAPVCKYLVRNEDGVSFASYLLTCQDKTYIDVQYYLKDSVLEGGLAFEKCYGEEAFGFFGKDPKINDLYNRAMVEHSTLVMNKILKTYKGFEGLNVLVDVGGGVGGVLKLITSKYPTIKGINYDLLHVIERAPLILGVEHDGGDMFSSVPKGDAHFMKSILHDWSDELCLKLLKNCYEALPSHGKVIVVETNLPEVIETNHHTQAISQFDVLMMLHHGGKERTLREFEILANGAGFADFKLVSQIYSYSIMEFYKSNSHS